MHKKKRPNVCTLYIVKLVFLARVSVKPLRREKPRTEKKRKHTKNVPDNKKQKNVSLTLCYGRRTRYYQGRSKQE